MGSSNASILMACVGSLLLTGGAAGFGSPAHRPGAEAFGAHLRVSGSPEKVIAAFEDDLAQAGRLGSAVISEHLLEAAGRIEQLARAGAPESEMLRVARSAKSQIAHAAMRSVQSMNQLSRDALSALETMGAPPEWLRQVALGRAEAVDSMWRTARWAQRLVDQQVDGVLSGV